ncbi:hypothetical protein Asi03nite_01980 [Actinoplanes siamensis]|uniref:Uncharacterized protein n=1 Tax=Actinoplanes siamensis TaxID=1223317 RepID=A0A919KA64_9ACTN|nr:hypothetical protein Asi03nite_01980 [Actinoplanes siamensis]
MYIGKDGDSHPTIMAMLPSFGSPTPDAYDHGAGRAPGVPPSCCLPRGSGHRPANARHRRGPHGRWSTIYADGHDGEADAALAR